jgi:hypothetical protein
MPRCEQCQRDFATEEGLQQHARDKHGAGRISRHEMREQRRQERDAEMEQESAKRKRGKMARNIAIIAVVVIVLGAAGYFVSNLPKGPGSFMVSGVECSRMEQTNFHIHAHLDVFVDGVQQVVPENIGIMNSCLFWLHTHDERGVIHIEAPTYRIYTLGQFVDVWANSTVDQLPAGTPTAYVNGQPAGDYRSIELGAHQEIALVYGMPPAVIPSTYTFAPGE